MTQFTHLHVHSHYSILDGMSKIPDLIKKCKKNGMYAMALTDHGNMYGIKDLLDTVNKENDKVNDAIKEQQAILKKDEATAEEKEAAQQQIAILQSQLFKPIVGIEAYCARRTLYDKDKNVRETNPETGRERIVDSSGYHLILLAKNKQGYKNLCKLSSIAFTDGFYNRPRIDRNVLEQYHEGLIVCSACLGGELPQKILRGNLAAVDEAVLWYKRVFGDDYYIELQRHKTDKPGGDQTVYERQQQVNPILIEMARKHNIKIICTNDVHFVEEEHGDAHDHLICISTQAKINDPNRMHYTKQEWLKTPDEMAAIFSDLPEALANTQEIVDKVETYSINSDPIMPVFPIPESFGSEAEYRSRITEQELFDEFTRNERGEVVLSQADAEKKIKKLGGYDKLYRIKFEADYLAKLVWEGAHKRYGDELSEAQRDRIIFELHTIKTMGFPGYFLIVQDYIRGAREELDVSVGPGRGSAAGSVVAYCLKITDLDPLKYDLLFERFLNPDRISLPDIDVDFEDSGRGRVLEWVTEKYGKEKVAHIITYGAMATKSSIADVGRVEDVPLNVVAQLKSYVPEKSFPDNIKDEKGKSPKVNLSNCYKYVPEFRSIMEGNDPAQEGLRHMLTYAEELENTNRQVGIHACGVIIGADDLTNFAPVCTINDKKTGEDVVVTQYDGHVVESVGLIKMDFLGLSNLSIIKDTIRAVKRNRGIDIDIDNIPIDDPLTYDLYCKGNTVGTFQFESPGMQKYLRELHPEVFGDLIAMNALYRPGPMDYIPRFIRCKHGDEPITYDIPVMEKYLKETYGVTVYQEQVMLLSRLLANFTRGESDTLRKAMGKKQIEKMMELKGKFLEGGQANGHPKDKLEKIWADWEKFASYAFNKSHAACYSWVAYQTAYLKAHYTPEYMAAVLTSEQADNKRVTELMEDCRKNNINVMLPSINESMSDFAATKDGQIRFGLQGIVGMGEAAANAIIEEREKNGPYKDIFDFMQRVNLRTVNRKNIEVMVKAGAFDGVGSMHRAQYFVTEGNSENAPTYVERLVRWALREQESKESAQMSIFDLGEDIRSEAHPAIPQCEPWSTLERCRYEKEVIGFYISGHPLDDFRLEMQTFAIPISRIENKLEEWVDKDIRIAGLITSVKTGTTKRGSPFGVMTITDYDSSFEVALFDDKYLKYQQYFVQGLFVFCRGTARQFPPRVTADGIMKVSPPRFEVINITMLNTLLNEYSREVKVDVLLNDVNDKMITSLRDITESCQGNVPFSVRVHQDSEVSLCMRNPSLRINPRTFIDALKTQDWASHTSIVTK